MTIDSSVLSTGDLLEDMFKTVLSQDQLVASASRSSRVAWADSELAGFHSSQVPSWGSLVVPVRVWNSMRPDW